MIDIYFNDLMKQMFDDCLKEFDLPELRSELQKLLNQGFAEYDECYFFKSVVPKSFGKTKFVPYVGDDGYVYDETTREMLYNQLYPAIELSEWTDSDFDNDDDYDFENQQFSPSNIKFMTKMKLGLVQQSIVATFETARLISQSLPGSFRIILQFSSAKRGGKDRLEDPKVRFHKIREDQTYFSNDLNNFKTNPMLAIDIDDSPQTQQFLQHHTNLEILKKFINLPDRNIMP